MDEQYIYLGYQADTHFFFHTIVTPNFEKTVSDQIYNVMIHEKRITDPQPNVLIYEINVINGAVYLTTIQHAMKKGGMFTFDRDNVVNILGSLVASERTQTYIIRYNVQKGCYETFEVEGDLIGATASLVPDDTPPISEVREIVTTKPFE